ncbi:hypothetical protein NliqN6_4843 [Naganishia liquefaciens]|uniref:Tetratricopeptide repeat protein n=1 Tax=Naganishia liquefaciens TaxID=104408 RepID=A0A8H3TVP7_9TREE|nr:hypothetical protein NliqN6_4843 [Naganishia liquefaciens]
MQRQAIFSLRRTAAPAFSRALRVPANRTFVHAARSRYAFPRTAIFSKRFASSDSAPTLDDPAERQAMDALEEGTRHLEEGNVEAARDHYERSVGIQKSAAALFNLGVTEYHLQNVDAAIDAWKQTLEIAPSADAHTNIASAYILAKPPQAALAIDHLRQALELSPEDPEIAFNLAAVLESTGNNEPALTLYEKAVSLGIERAQQNVRNVKAKIVAAKAEAEAATGKASQAEDNLKVNIHRDSTTNTMQ